MKSKQDGRKCDHGTLEQMRLQAMAKVAGGESPEDVVKSLGLSRSCIYKWMAKFRMGGTNALKAKKISGRPLKLETAQVEWLRDILLESTPRSMGFNRGLWTREIVKELIFKKYAVSLSLPSVSRMLVKVGVVFHPPLNKTDDRKIGPLKNWLDSDYVKIKAGAKKNRAEVLICWDDYLFSLLDNLALVQISAVNSRGVEQFLLTEDPKKEESIYKFIDSLCFGRKQAIYLVLNNLPVYKSFGFKNHVLKYREVLTLFYMPLRLSIFWHSGMEKNS